MAEIAGLGNCGICMQPIQDAKTGVASPVRHFKGHLLAHKRCSEELEEFKKTPGYEIQQLKQKIGTLTNQLNAAQAALEAAERELAALVADED